MIKKDSNPFLIINTHKDKHDNIITEFIETDGKILIKHFNGVNTDNYILKKSSGKRLQFSLFKLNGIYYVNINGEHIIDYRKFINIQSIINNSENNSICIKNIYIGKLTIQECDTELFQKALEIMAKWIKQRKTWYSELLYWISF